MATVLSSHGLPSGAEPQAASSSTPKALWITVGVLAVVTSALAGALVVDFITSAPASADATTASTPTVIHSALGAEEEAACGSAPEGRPWEERTVAMGAPFLSCWRIKRPSS